ncbi:MAG TPA: prepilin-type N-terminal cleavage/methylation domain-containing protein [Firmicutes bacterium]|nr:prepilin-type N-terminal cleavage/methylation domain-containing protein [Bacillota bacterium]
MRSVRSEQAFTLVEILVALAILGLIFVGIYSFYLWGVNSCQKGIRRMDNQQNARIAMDYLVDELRFARQVQVTGSHEIKFWFSGDPKTYIFRQSGEEIVFETKNGYPSHNKIALGVTELFFNQDPAGGNIQITIVSGTGKEQVTLSCSICPRNVH